MTSDTAASAAPPAAAETQKSRLHRLPETLARPVARSLARHPMGWIALAMLVFTLVPAFDLWVAGLTFDPATGGFPPKEDQPWRFLLRATPAVIYGALIYLAVLWAAERLGRLPGRWITGRPLAYLWATLLLGPGLIVNLLYKSHWGRARPNDIQAFGGEATFTPPFLISDACASNCSFPSGHAALGFWTLAPALLAPPAWRPWAVTAALSVGVVLGGSRIVLGAHFLSDTLASGLLVIGLNLALYRVMIAGPDRRHTNNAG